MSARRVSRWQFTVGKGQGRGSQVWQGKDLREGVFGSVAMIGVTGDFSEVWQIQELATFWRKAGDGEEGVRSAARRGRMGLASGTGYRQSRVRIAEAIVLHLDCLSSDK